MNGLDALAGLVTIFILVGTAIGLAEGFVSIVGFFMGVVEERGLRKQEISEEKKKLREEIKRIENDS